MLREAIRYFWTKRAEQIDRQGSANGVKDADNRGAVTGGAQLDGFIELVETILKDAGVPAASIHRQKTTLPGYYRPTKEWDLVVVHEGNLVAAIEFKSQVGPSFGNNFNNRVEEALGSSADLWTAYREGAFPINRRPWLGYFLLLEKHDKSLSPVKLDEPHFEAFPEFAGTSYKDRYRIFCEKLLRERMYDAACYLLSEEHMGVEFGQHEEPAESLGFIEFKSALVSKAGALKTKQ